MLSFANKSSVLFLPISAGFSAACIIMSLNKHMFTQKLDSDDLPQIFQLEIGTGSEINQQEVRISFPFSRAPWSISKCLIKLCAPVSSSSYAGTLFVGIQLRHSAIHTIFSYCKLIHNLMSLLAQLSCKQKLSSKQYLAKSLYTSEAEW